MKHLKTAISAMLIPLLGVCSCSSQRAATKVQKEKLEQKHEQEAEQRDTVFKKRIESEFRNPTPVVYGPPPSVYEKMPEDIPEGNYKKD